MSESSLNQLSALLFKHFPDTQIAEYAAKVIEEANSEISQLRHDLLNEQAASRMAHEVVARNRALEAENAQLRHSLANAEVAAGFAKEMAEKVKYAVSELELLAALPDSHISIALSSHILRILRTLQP